ncbi:MAG TPA: MFS transporter [Candidatus Binatia bacterium]
MRFSFFYGWLIVAVCMLAGFFASGVSNITMAVVLKPISEDLGWSRTLTAAALTAGALLGGGLAPFFGPIADRFGPRVLLPGGAALMGGLAIALSASTQPWQFYAAFVPARALTEFLMTGVVPFTAVANWFYRKRPRAMGLVALSVPLGGSVLSLVYQYLVANYGWRSAFFTLGIGVWLLVVFPGLIILRRQPEDLGLKPDGANPQERDRRPKLQTPASEAEFSWQKRDALRTAALWLVVASTFLASISTGGIAFHMAAHLTDIKMRPVVAAGVVSWMALSGAFGNGLWGTLAERIQPRRLSIATMLLAALAVALLMSAQSPLMAYAFGLLFGLSARGSAILIQVLLSRYFGRRSFGAISSVLDPFHKGGLGLGPLLAGIAFDQTHSYTVIFSAFLACYCVAAALIFFARQPQSVLRPVEFNV